MRPAEQTFLDASDGLQQWVSQIPEAERHGEWECEYPHWGDVYAAWTALLESSSSPREWTEELCRAALFAIARDNEDERRLRTKRGS